MIKSHLFYCGANITYSIIHKKWHCKYCDSFLNVDKLLEEKKETGKQNPSTHNKNQVCYCDNCGAKIICPDSITSTYCSYCGSPLILKDRINSKKTPDFIIPFSQKKEEAFRSLRKQMRYHFLIPSYFRKHFTIDEFQGIYLPFWSFDLQVNGEFSYCIPIEKDNSKIYKKVYSGNAYFNKVSIKATDSFSNALIESLEPYNLTELVPYNELYLLGFMSQTYDVSSEEALGKAQQRVNRTAYSFFQKKSHNLKSHKDSTLYSFVTTPTKTYYILLPVWMFSTSYKEKEYFFLMNGQTGKVCGNVPISNAKKIILFLVIFALLITIVFVYK